MHGVLLFQRKLGLVFSSGVMSEHLPHAAYDGLLIVHQLPTEEADPPDCHVVGGM